MQRRRRHRICRLLRGSAVEKSQKANECEPAQCHVSENAPENIHYLTRDYLDSVMQHGSNRKIVRVKSIDIRIDRAVAPFNHLHASDTPRVPLAVIQNWHTVGMIWRKRTRPKLRTVQDRGCPRWIREACSFDRNLSVRFDLVSRTHKPIPRKLRRSSGLSDVSTRSRVGFQFAR